MSRPNRLSTFRYVGPARYFLTFCTAGRKTAFREPDVAEMVLTQFRRTAEEDAFTILAYCLMPDHAHLLVEALGEQSDLRSFAKMAKQRSGGAYQRRAGERLWQPGYYERVLRGHEDAKTFARYTVNNPVRAKIVANANDYPYVGSDRWSMSELLDSVAW